MCDRIGIMYRGRIVEEGNTEDIFGNPQHIYTKRLLSAIPNIDPQLRKKQADYRNRINNEFKSLSSDYFDEKGNPYKLKEISPTHRVALPYKE
jgi:peptide/nickel transport system ATP-binding protein